MKRILLFIVTNLAVLGKPGVDSEEPRHDRDDEQHGQVGRYEQQDAFHEGSPR